MRLLWLVPCGVTACFQPGPRVGLACTATGDCPEGQVCGPDQRCNPPGATADACASCPVVVARYDFEGNCADSGIGAHDGVVAGTGDLTFVPSQLGQGLALRIPPAATAWAHVADSPAFDLESGEVDLMFRIGTGAPAGDLGLISRDASGTVTGGHFNIRVGHDRRVVTRIQVMSNPTIQTYRCTAQPVAIDAWHHVVVRFGPTGLTLTVDDAVADGTQWVDLNGDPLSCVDPWTTGIDGNDNPWVIGGLTVGAVDGTGAPVSSVAASVDLDAIELRSVP